MGNRAVITTEDRRIGIYLHWNGGRDSVNAFLAYCNLKGYRCPELDNYGWARLCQVIGNFFPGDSSVGIDEYRRLDRDNYDNGVYIIKDWKVIGRVYCHSGEQKGYELLDLMKFINSRMPEKEQVADEVIEKWCAEHGNEYNYDIVDMLEDEE